MQRFLTHPVLKTSISSVVSAAILLAPLSHFPAHAQAAPAADYQACQAADDQAFRQAIEAVTVQALTSGLKGVDYQATVDSQWKRLEMDQLLDKRVDLAVDEVRNETSLGALMKSLADQQKAQELATAVADRVYKSEAVQTAIATLATGVGTEVGKRIEVATEDAAGPALECLKTFLGPRYGSAVAAAVTGTAGQEFSVDANKGGAEVTPGSVIKQSGQGITGAAILLMRRQLANMASRIGQRVVGSVLARLVSVVAGGVGLVLLAKDIWDLRHGVLPIVSEEMKSVETKQKVREELAKSLSDEIGVHVREIGSKAADRVVDVWQQFRQAHAKALELADRNLGFKAFLDVVKPQALPRLDEVTAIILAREGESGILTRLENGTLGRAISVLPESGMAIARETQSIDKALQWSDLAGSNIGAVVEHAIYQKSEPTAFNKGALEKILALNDPVAIPKLAAISPEARDVLFEVQGDKLKALARALSGAELTTLSGYLTGLKPEPRTRVLDAISDSPAKIQLIASDRIRGAIIASTDQMTAVDMMLRPEGAVAQTTISDFAAAWRGDIRPILIWEKHTLWVTAAGAFLLFLALWLRRLFRPASPRRTA